MVVVMFHPPYLAGFTLPWKSTLTSALVPALSALPRQTPLLSGPLCACCDCALTGADPSSSRAAASMVRRDILCPPAVDCAGRQQARFELVALPFATEAC